MSGKLIKLLLICFVCLGLAYGLAFIYEIYF